MKKIYSMFAMALVAGSMVAAEPTISSEALVSATLPMSEEGVALYRAQQAYDQYVSSNDIEMPGMVRNSWTDGSGNVWAGRFYVAGTWNDYFNLDGDDYKTLREGFVKASASLTCSATGNTVRYEMWYPTRLLWDKSSWAQLGLDGIKDTDPVPLGAYEKNIASAYGFAVPAASSTANSFSIGMTDTDGDGTSDAFLIMNANTPSSSGYWYQSSSFGYARYNNTLCAPAKGSRFAFSNYDSSTNSINMSFTGTATTGTGSTVWTYDLQYSGEATIIGFPDAGALNTELSELHIVNLGVQDYENNENYDVEWDAPLRAFYFIGCNKDQTLAMDAQPSGSTVWWSKDTYPETALYTSEAAAEGSTGCNIHGTIFSPQTEADPFGEWSLYNIKTTGSNPNWLTTNAPVAWSWLDGNWIYPWSENNGTRGYYCGLLVTYDPTSTSAPYVPFIMNGTTKGFGVKGISRMSEAIWHFDGNIVYHYDESDFTKVKNIAAVGTREPNNNWGAVNTVFGDAENGNFNVVANNGNINVTVDNAANVVIYNIAGAIVKNVNAAAGQTVNANVANGIYIVKVGEKAVKVIL